MITWHDYMTWLNDMTMWYDYVTWLRDMTTWLRDMTTWLRVMTRDMTTCHDYMTTWHDYVTWLRDMTTWHIMYALSNLATSSNQFVCWFERCVYLKILSDSLLWTLFYIVKFLNPSHFLKTREAELTFTALMPLVRSFLSTSSLTPVQHQRNRTIVLLRRVKPE